jgi:hypothetical protein
MAFLLSSSLLCFTAGLATWSGWRVAAGANFRIGGTVLFDGLFLQPSEIVHCLCSLFSSVSARESSSRSSNTRRSCAAIAMMNSSLSAGGLKELNVDVSMGVGGIEDVGVGLEEKLLGSAIGSVKESRFAVREAGDVERMERVSNVSLCGGGGMGAGVVSVIFDPSSSTCPTRSSLPTWDEGTTGVAGAACSGPRSMLEAFNTASEDTSAFGEARDRRRSKPISAQTNGLSSR